MTEKEKAQELVQKFRDCIDMESNQGFDTKDEQNLINISCVARNSFFSLKKEATACTKISRRSLCLRLFFWVNQFIPG